MPKLKDAPVKSRIHTIVSAKENLEWVEKTLNNILARKRNTVPDDVFDYLNDCRTVIRQELTRLKRESPRR